MESTKSLNTPYDSKQNSISSNKKPKSPQNPILKRKKTTFSQDYSKLGKIICSLHSSVIKIICTDSACELNCLLCEKCDLFPHKNHELQHLTKFLQSSMSNLEQKIRKQDEKALHQIVEINKFTNEAESELLSFVKCINQQKLEIKKDYERVKSEIENLLDQWKFNVNKMRGKLDDTLIEVRDLILSIKSYSNEESPVMKLILSETSLDKLFDDLVKMNQNTDAMKIQNVFKHLIKVFNKNYAHQSSFDNEEQKVIQAGFNEIVTILNAIRIKVQNPPRYKHFQNALDKFNGFVSKISELKDFSKDLSKLLLMSQVNLNLQLNTIGKNTLHNSTIISSDSMSYIVQNPESKLCNIEFLSNLKSKHKKGITCCTSYGPYNFVTGSFDERLIIWNLKTFQEVNEPKAINLKKVPSCLMTLLDEHGNPKKLIIGNKDGFVVILDANFKINQILKEHESQVSCFGSLRNGVVLVSGAYDATIAIYVLNNNDDKFAKIRRLEEMESINCLDIYDDQRFITGSDDCMIKLWEVSLNTTENKWSIDMSRSIVNDYSVNFLKLCKVNKRIIAVNSFNKINLWDIDTQRLLNKLKIHREGISKFGLIEFKFFNLNLPKKKPKHNTWDPNKEFQDINEQITNVNLITKDPIYLLSFGEDHKIILTDINNYKKIDERISYKGDVDLSDSSMSLMYFTDEKDDKIYFLNCINRDNTLNLWTINFENSVQNVG